MPGFLQSRKGTRPLRSRNDRIVQVSEEHCGDLVERYFTTLDRVEEEYGEFYADDDYWHHVREEDHKSLTDEVKNTGKGHVETKYRYITVKAVDMDDPQHSVEPLADYRDNDLGWIAGYRIPRYLEEGEDYDCTSETVNITDEELEYLGYSPKEIKHIRDEFSKGNYEPQILAYKEVWDPRYTPEELHPRLKAMGIDPKYYDPEVNKYRGSYRGTFNIGRKRRRRLWSVSSGPGTSSQNHTQG